MELKVYKEISADVWKLFKKYVLTGIDLNDFAADVHVLDRKYENNREEFMFMNKLLKVYFDELHRIRDKYGEVNQSDIKGLPVM